VILYLDTSALVKLIIREDSTADAVAWFERADLIASSVITYAEACSALGQNDRRRGNTPSQLGEWLIALDGHWREVMRVPVAEWPAGKLALAHRLRGMDAVQLAAAITLRERLRAGTMGSPPAAEVAFAGFDQRLLEAAEREGFATLGGPLA
jgi:predicted nucleic acid-binding protein